MNTMEVLTLLLVVFAALSYIDHRNNKKKQHPTVLRFGAITHQYTEGKSDSYPITFEQIIHQGG